LFGGLGCLGILEQLFASFEPKGSILFGLIGRFEDVKI